MRVVGIYLVLLLAVLLPYASMLDAPLLWDDRTLVLESFQAQPGPSLASYFSEPFWQDRGSGEQQAYYRPLTRLSFAADHALHGENPAGYHLTNVLLHAANALLLLALLLRTRVNAAWALLLSAAWALQPRLSEAAAWVSGRTDVLAATCCLVALLVYRPRQVTRACVASFFVLLGLLAKEVALAAWATLLLRELMYRRTTAEPRGAALRAAAPLLLALAAYAALRQTALAGVTSPSLPLTAGQRALAACEALGRYGYDALLPWLPRTQQGELGHASGAFVAAGALGLLVILGLAWGRWRQANDSSKEAAVLGAVSLGLVLHVVPLPIEVVAYDRFLYFPLLALALGVAGAISVEMQQARAARLVAAGLVVSLAAGLVLRLRDWQNELKFWRSAYQTTPKSNARPGNELGGLFYRAGLFAMAAQVYEQVAKDARDPTVALGNLGSAWAELGRTSDAVPLLERLCREQPRVAKYCLDAGLANMQELRLEQARSLVREAARRSPGFAAPRGVLDAIAELERFQSVARPTSSDPLGLLRAQFQFAKKAGRRGEGLQLGERLLAELGAPPELTREAAEFCVRFAPPGELLRVAKLVAARGALTPALSAIANLRLDDGKPLLEAWPTLGFTGADER